jgi:hypothetical protein
MEEMAGRGKELFKKDAEGMIGIQSLERAGPECKK